MSKKKKSTGAVLLSFLRVLITLVLIFILVGSVTLNIAFYNADKPVEVNINLPFYKQHTTYFINNSGDLNGIEKGALVIINPEITPSPGVYVLCTIGKSYKTVLAVTEEKANDNGTVSYVLKGTKDTSTISHTVPAYKIHGTVTQKNVWLGDIIEFTRSIAGIAAFMAIPSFLLILICVVSIKRNKSRYEDDLLESEILIEELRKIKKIEGKKKKAHAAENLDNESAPEYNESEYIVPEEAEPALPFETDDDSSVKDEMNRKAMEIKNAMHNQMANEGKKAQTEKYDKNPSANEIMDQMSDEMKTPSKSREKQASFENYTSLRTQAVSREREKNDTSDDQVYQQQMAQLQAKQQQMAKLRQSQPVIQHSPQEPVQPVAKAPVYPQSPVQTPVYQQPIRQDYTYQEPVQTQTPVYQEPAPQQYSQPVDYYQPPRTTPAKKKHKKPSSQKINADSFDDLIKMLDNEKKKLD